MPPCQDHQSIVNLLSELRTGQKDILTAINGDVETGAPGIWGRIRKVEDRVDSIEFSYKTSRTTVREILLRTVPYIIIGIAVWLLSMYAQHVPCQKIQATDNAAHTQTAP